MKNFISNIFLSLLAFLSITFWAHCFYGVPIRFSFSTETTSAHLNYSIYHWKQNALKSDTVIIGSSMALNNFHPPRKSKLKLNVFGSWGLNPIRGLQIFNTIFSSPKLSLIPLSIPEATMDPAITENVMIARSLRINSISEWNHFNKLRADSLAFTSMNFSKAGNVPLATIRDGFTLVERRNHFEYHADSTTLNEIINNPINNLQNIKYILLPWRDKGKYQSISTWMDNKCNHEEFIDLRDCPIQIDSWLDGTHLDSIGAKAIYACLESKLLNL